jgi:pectin methylesterase-like acyl-CoA thioesterase
VSGKTVSFSYKGLDYGTDYTFTLPASSVSDLTDNAVAEDITISFTTMERPTVAKDYYDFVVPDDGTLKEAIDAANSRDDKSTRYRIFVKKGEYKLPTGANKHYKHTNNDGYVYWEGDLPDPITYVTAANISLIGEDRDATIVTQDISNDDDMLFQGQYGPTHKYEEIKNSAVLQLEGSATGMYFQDITIKSGINDALGRNLAVYDKSSKNIYKNTLLYGYQDTWTSNNQNGLFYFEGGQVRGRTDYLCGKGDAYFNGLELRQMAGGYAAVPSTPKNVGWVFKDCIFSADGSGVNNSFTLGRPWGKGTPVAVFIDTKMNVTPKAEGWNEMSNNWPKRFAEYNSMNAQGKAVSLSARKTLFSGTHQNEPVLTEAEADAYSDMAAMFGDWQPTLATEQAPVPANVVVSGARLTWDASDYVLLWAVCKDGSVVDFTTEPSYTVVEDGTYSVRAANEMGGLSEASQSVAVSTTGISSSMLGADAGEMSDSALYDLQGRRVLQPRRGLYIRERRKVTIK